MSTSIRTFVDNYVVCRKSKGPSVLCKRNFIPFVNLLLHLRKVVGRGRPRKVAHDQLRIAPIPGQQLAMSACSSEEDSAWQPSTDTPEPLPSTSRDPKMKP
ncbi:unnamed protein product, partial [Iphiclides podalirius]